MSRFSKSGEVAFPSGVPIKDPISAFITPEPDVTSTDTAESISVETQTLLNSTFGSWAMSPNTSDVVAVEKSPISPVLNKSVESFMLFMSGTRQQRDRALCQLLEAPLKHEVRTYILTSGGAPALIDYAAEYRELKPESQKMALQVLFALTMRLNKVTTYPSELNDSHYGKLAHLLVEQADCLFYVLWTLYELTKFPQGRRSVVDVGLPEILGRIVVANVDSRVITAALYVLFDLADDEICSEALIQLDVFGKFRTAFRGCLVRQSLKADATLPMGECSDDRIFMWAFAQCSDEERLQINDMKLVATYWRLYGRLPDEWLKLVDYWIKLVLALIRHNVVVQHATTLRQPIFEALELVIIFANEQSLIELVRILSVYVSASNSHALNWIFNGGVVDTMLVRFPWRLYENSLPTTQYLLEELLILIGHILDVIPTTTCSTNDRLRQKLYSLFDDVFEMKWPKHVDEKVLNIAQQAHRLLLPGVSSISEMQEDDLRGAVARWAGSRNAEATALDSER
ncbi:hypothetical protein BIW11_12239 [Tropilaelaps mercedesae]|uniref:Uncharacterized protein n=1 Tax=Tropilaelaps mercedesae TaxID=418985 RepID=A0A1V9X839_9ACAR|nr:hypothetical protein BIW11_12239 [Tropilaelaps mercedesae]